MHLWWKISHSLQETIQAKCELDVGIYWADVAMCNHLNFHLRDGATAQWYQKVPKSLSEREVIGGRRIGFLLLMEFLKLALMVLPMNRGPASIGGVAHCGEVNYFSQFIRLFILTISWRLWPFYMLWTSVV